MSAPACLGEQASSDPKFDATPQTVEPPKSVTGVEISRLENSKKAGGKRNLTEKGLAYHLEIKLAKRNSAFKKSKKQIQKINALRASPETKIEQFEQERFYLDRLKDDFNDPHKEYDDLLKSDEEKQASSSVN